MAIYKVQAPDGKVIQVEGPDGASQEEVIAQAQRLYSGAPTKKSYEEMGFIERLGEGLPPAARSWVQGTVIDPINAIRQLMSEKQRAEVQQQEQAYQAAREAAGETGTDWTRIGGGLFNPLTMAPAAKVASLLGKGGAISRIGAGAAAGAAGTVAQPVMTDETDLGSFAIDKIQQIGLGAALGGLITGGIETVKGGANFVKELSKPLSESGRNKLIKDYLDSLVGSDKEKVISALQQAKPIVPGSKPTVAEAVAETPEAVNLAAAQQRLATMPEAAPTFAQRAVQQQAAREAQLRGFAGTPEELAAIEAERATVTAPMREEALAQANIAGQVQPGLEADVAAREASRIRALQEQGQLQAIAAEQTTFGQKFGTLGGKLGMPRLPSRYSNNADRISEAIDAAADAGQIVAQRAAERDFKALQLQSLADEGFFPLKVNDIVGKIDTIRVSPGQRSSEVVQKTFDSLRQKLTDPAYVKPNGIIDSRDLYTIRKEIGNDIAKFAEESKNWDQKMTAGLEKNIKTYIDNSIEAAGGVKWKDYLQNYFQYSDKINRMQIGQYLIDKLRSPLDAERAGAFAQAVQNAPATIKRASGAARFQELGQVLSPDETASVNAVLADLQRASKARELARASRASGIEADETQIPSLLSRTATIVNAIFKHLRGDANAQMNKEMAKLFTDPQAMAAFMSAGKPTQMRKVIDAIFPRLTPENQAILRNLVIAPYVTQD